MSTSHFGLRHRLIVIGAAATLGAGTFVATNLASAASGPSAVDYAQCANGAPNTTPACTWINGVLNANNSQYEEDQATPQRLMVSFNDTGAGSHTHSVTLRYLDRKGGGHAYDYLVSADLTQSDAVSTRCDGVPYAGCSGMTQGANAAIAPDDANIAPAANGVSTKVSDHMGFIPLAKRQLMIWGGEFATGTASPDGWPVNSTPPAMTTPVHDCTATSTCGTTGDDYATTTFSFVTQDAGLHYVQILFGGHLAAGDIGSVQTDGWGTGLGAASINGGPYHIKWAAADGVSVGNRDNQIMSNAITLIQAQGVTMSTTASPSSGSIDTVTTTSDYATLIVADATHGPTGTEVFDLYGPFATQPAATDTTPQCVDPVNGTGGNRVTELSTTTFTQDSTVLTKFTSATVSYNLSTNNKLGVGWYQWVAHYVPGSDPYNEATDGSCFTSSEQVHVTQATPAATSQQIVRDKVAVTGFGTPTGHVSYFIYTDCSAQATSLVWSDQYDSTKLDTDAANLSNVLSSGSATSDPFNAATDASQGNGSQTYYWKVTYLGDTNNAPATVEPCGTQQFSIQNHS